MDKGDKVRCLSIAKDSCTTLHMNMDLVGKCGEVLGFARNGTGYPLVLVEFYDNIGGHDGLGKKASAQITDNVERKGKAGHCWFLQKDELKVIK